MNLSTIFFILLIPNFQNIFHLKVEATQLKYPDDMIAKRLIEMMEHLFRMVLIIVCMCLIPGVAVFAQVSQGVSITEDNTDPAIDAMLDVKAAAKGILIPRVPLANRPVSATTSLLIYQTDNDPGYYYYDGSAWVRLATGSGGGGGGAGPTGPTGAAGADGTNGVDGATGAAGADGATGAAGTDGTNGLDGATGAAGADGTNGVDGATGAAGADGTNGLDGATGAAGADGTNGLDGATGAAGADGTNGVDGATGAAGADGTNGLDGATGAAGVDGTNGLDGATGVAGADGTNGTNGTNGATGPTGAAGADGTNGTNGTNGATGPTGAAGADGTNGVDGATGAAGTNGTNGVDGATGAAGADGTNGVDGATGAAGADGTNGTNGATGPTGAAGADGTNGVDGATGAAGTNGTNGVDGATGAAGADGTNGVDGATGAAGADGTNGVDGATGAAGADGTNGVDGATGAAGADGTNGTNGTNGTDGATGPTGVAGADGTNGTNGTNGATGPTGVAGADGTNGTNGATGPTGAAGADGTNGTDGVDGATGTQGLPGLNGAAGITGPTGPGGGSDADWFEVGTTASPTDINANIFTQGSVGIGTVTPSVKFEVSDATERLINLYRNVSPASAAANDNVFLGFSQNNSTGARITYAGIGATIEDPTAGAEAGALNFITLGLGGSSSKLGLLSDGTLNHTPSDVTSSSGPFKFGHSSFFNVTAGAHAVPMGASGFVSTISGSASIAASQNFIGTAGLAQIQTTGSVGRTIGVSGAVATQSAIVTVTDAIGVRGEVEHASTGTITNAIGVRGGIDFAITGAGLVTQASALEASINSAITTTTMNGLRVHANLVFGAATDYSGILVESPGFAALPTVTNAYGLNVRSVFGAANNYGIYVQNAGTYALWVDDGISRFDGNVGIGVTSPTAALQVGISDPNEVEYVASLFNNQSAINDRSSLAFTLMNDNSEQVNYGGVHGGIISPVDGVEFGRLHLTVMQNGVLKEAITMSYTNGVHVRPNMTIGASSTNPEVLLDLNSSDQALLLPRLNGADVTSLITFPVNGMMIYVHTAGGSFGTSGFWGYDSGWVKL